MIIIGSIKNIGPRIKASVLTIGVFDGIHIGHRRVIKSVVERARRLGAKSVVITFDPHPLKITHPGTKIPSLISLEHRIRLIGGLGADYGIILNFSNSVSGLSAEEFISKVLINKLGMKEMYAGENFYFGKDAKTGIKDLRTLAKKYGFRIHAVRPVKINKKIVSSSAIRKFIIEGDLRKAERFLGRPVSVLGTVVSGARLARQLGYPTANINPHHEVIPPRGVYAVLVRYDKKMLKGVLNIGFRPTFYSPRDIEPSIEAHIFDFNKRIYGKDLEILFIKKIRDEKKFKDTNTLVKRVRQDERIARSILS